MKNEKDIIMDAVSAFIEAGDKSDSGRLEEVLHTEYRNVQNGLFDRLGTVSIGKAEYISLIREGKFGGVERSLDFLECDCSGPVGMVKVKMESEQMIFVSYILLAKEGQEWKVTGNYPDYSFK